MEYSTAAQKLKVNKDWSISVLIFLTAIEIFAYLVFYIFQYFAKEPTFVAEVPTGFNIAFLVSVLLKNLIASTTIFVIFIKAILVLKNLYSKQYIQTSLSSAVITFLSPAVIMSLYVFLHTFVNVFILKQPGAATTSYANTVLFLAPIPFLIASWLFIKYRKQERNFQIATLIKENTTSQWILAIVSALIIGGMVFGAQSGLGYIRTKEVKRLATEESLGVLVTEKDKTQQVNMDLTKATSDDNFAVTLEWNSPSPVETGTRLLVIYSNPLMNYRNPSGQEISSQIRSSCTVQKSNNGSYSCYVKFSSSPPGGGLDKKESYMFFIDKSTGGTASDRDERRKTDMKKLQIAFSEYLRTNSRYPCSGEYQYCRDGQVHSVFKGKELPQFDWKPYGDPLPNKHYSIFTSTTENINFEPPSFLAYAELEIAPSEFFCVDGNGNQKIVPRRPNPTVFPYSCNNLWLD